MPLEKTFNPYRGPHRGHNRGHDSLATGVNGGQRVSAHLLRARGHCLKQLWRSVLEGGEGVGGVAELVRRKGVHLRQRLLGGRLQQALDAGAAVPLAGKGVQHLRRAGEGRGGRRRNGRVR